MQELPYFKAFPSDWEQAMRRADIPAEDRGEVYRLIFFAWADGGLNWEDETAMRRYAKEMGWQWRRFSRTLDHYKRLCSPDLEYRLPVFLLRNFKQSLPEVSSKFPQSLPEVSPKFEQSFPQVSAKFESSLPEVSSEFDAEIGPKSNDHVEPPNKSEVRINSHSYSQKSEVEADGGAPFDSFDDQQAEIVHAITTLMGLSRIPEGIEAEKIYQAAEEFHSAGVSAADIPAYEQDFYRRKVALGKPMVLTLKILRQDLAGWVRSRRLQGEIEPPASAPRSARDVQREQAREEARRRLFGGNE